MNKDICILVGWQRPEFMTVCMEQIVKAERSEELHYIIALDEGYDVKYYDVIDNFPYECSVIKMPKSGYRLGKQSYNVMNSLITAAEMTKEFVFYVEEDIFVGVDFFNWHYAVHSQQPDCFCSIATKTNDSEHKVTTDPALYYFGNAHDYQSWGNCFRKDKLLNYLKPHFAHEYFSDPCRYCVNNFPENYLKNNFCEQDGLTKRIMMKAGMLSIFPDVPRAYHAGFYGYNRLQAREKTYEKRVEKIKKVCFDPVEMEKACLKGYYKDSKPIDLTIKTNNYAERKKL